MTEKLAKRGIPAQTMIRLPQVMEMVGLGNMSRCRGMSRQ